MDNYRRFESPVSGGKLEYTEYTDEKNIFRDHYTGVYVYLKKDGTLMPLLSPTSGRKLTIKSDGTYWADGHQFILDERGVLPTFIPDDTLEPAHVEGDCLVGNETGRRFPIRDNGFVMVPYDPIDIDPDLPIEELKAYYEARKQRQYNETQDFIDAKIEEQKQQQAEAIQRIRMEGELARFKLKNKDAREKTERFLKIVKDELANGHDLTQDEYEKLDLIGKNGGYLPPDFPDSEIAYDPTYVFLQTKLAQVKAGYGLSQEDLAKIDQIINGPKEEENHTK